MGRTIISILGLASVLLATNTLAQGPDRAWSLDIGSSSSNAARGHEELDIYRIGLQWDWKRTLWQGDSASLGGYWEASVNFWGADHDDVTAAAVSPVFVLSFGDRSAGFRPYVEAGVGLSILSDDVAGGRLLGSSWQFEDRIGFGLASDRWDIHYRYMHYSNGDIDKPNQGVDAHVIGVSVSY
jgi:lipid A 3-O-deacylase